MDTEQTDEEWRAQRFSDEELAGARLSDRQFGASTYKELLAALERFGPDGILETAILLPRAQFERLEQRVKGAPKQKIVRRRR